MRGGLRIIPFFLLISFHLFSQDFEKKITLSIRNQPLSSVIKEIGEKGKIRFSYSAQQIPAGRIVTIKAKNKSIREILDDLCTRYGLEYLKVENQVILRKKTGKTGESGYENRSFTIRGYVRDKGTGEVLIGANVYLAGTTRGTVTNSYGFYSFTVPGGQQTISASFVGYKGALRPVEPDSGQVVNFELDEAALQMNEVEIISPGKMTDPLNDQLSRIGFTAKTLEQLPGFIGDLDVIKALQSVPGIKAYGDGSALFYVRGGNSDQNLVMIDDAPIYTPSHLFGYISAITPDAINDIQIYKGDFPANYGGRLSSVIDVRAKDGNMKRLSFGGNIGPYTSSLTFEGPILKDKISFFLTGRLSTLFWMRGLNTAIKSFDFGFYDINGKINFKPNANNRFFITMYYGNDNLTRVTNNAITTYGISWHNMAGTFRWNHVFSSKLFNNLTLNYSRYNYFLYLSEDRKDYWNSSISGIRLKNDLTWYLNRWNQLKGGIEVSYHMINPGNVRFANPASDTLAPEIPEYKSTEYTLYLANEQNIGKRWLLRYGIRIPVWQDWGPTTLYSYDVNHTVIDTTSVGKNVAYSSFISVEPRVSVQFLVSERSAIKASYNRMTQFLQVLTNSVSPFTSLEVWAPSGPIIEPQTADQVSLGYSMKFLKPSLILSAEGFYKFFAHHIDFRDHANLLYNSRIEGELRFGKAESYGVEVMVRKNTGKLKGWISYTYSRAIITTAEVNNGKPYPAYYDSPNNVTVNLSYEANPRWAISADWIYMSGMPFTSPVGFIQDNGYTVPVFGSKNNDRLPDYHRLDLSVSYILNKPGNRYHHNLIFTLYNVYGRFNPFSVSFNKYEDSSGDFLVPSNLYGGYQLVPTAISVAGIIPSINYQFKF